MRKCPVCGFENSKVLIECEGGCGFVRIAETVVLSVRDTVQCVRLHVRTAIGRRILRILNSDLALFASEEQFTLSPEPDLRGWLIIHSPSAKNSTKVGGKVIPADGCIICDGDLVTLGGYSTPIKISLEW
jgi:hypothetical protein